MSRDGLATAGIEWPRGYHCAGTRMACLRTTPSNCQPNCGYCLAPLDQAVLECRSCEENLNSIWFTGG